MNWMIKVSIGMLLFATLLIALGVVFIRANEFKTNVNQVEKKIDVPTIEVKPLILPTPAVIEKTQPIKK